MHLISLVIACSMFTQAPSSTVSTGPSPGTAESPASAAGNATLQDHAGHQDHAAPRDNPISMDYGGLSAEMSPEEPAKGSTSGGSLRDSLGGAEEPEDIRVLPLRTNSRRVTPEELVARAISSTATDEIPGEPLSLLAALSNVHGQAERISAVRAYWESTFALARYGVTLDENRQLADFTSGTALASSAQTVERARLAAIEAQRRLAGMARLPKSIQLPIASDPPHTRAYNTRFGEIFSSSAPTDRMWLMDRRLPIRLETLQARAKAVLAREDVLDALSDSYREGKIDPASVAVAVYELARQRRAFLEAVRDYNFEIADYALSIAGQEVTGKQLVATLIDVNRASANPAPSEEGALGRWRRSDVQQAEYVTPLSADREGFWEPTRAVAQPSRINAASATEGEGPGQPPLPPSGTTEDEVPGNRNLTGALGRPTTLVPPPPRPKLSEPAVDEKSTTDSPSQDSSAEFRSAFRLPLVPVERTAYRLPLDDTALPRFADLAGAEAAMQAERLVAVLFASDVDVSRAGQPVTLSDCLAGRSVDECHQVRNAYWLASLRACEYQAYLDCAGQLWGLAPDVASHALESMGPEDMLRLHAMRLSCDADALEARARLLDAQFDLTVEVGQPLDASWLLPGTSPHAGPFPLKLDIQPISLAQSWPIRRLEVAMPALWDAVMSRADALVQADAVRADAIDRLANRTGSMDEAVTAIQQQSQQTLEFLDTVTAYNQSIAQYVAKTKSDLTDEIPERLPRPMGSGQ